MSKLDHEDIDYERMKESFGFYVHAQGFHKQDRVKYSEEQIINGEIFEISFDSMEPADKVYLDPKKKIDSLKQEFENKTKFGFLFRASYDEFDQLSKDIRFLYTAGDKSGWILASKDSIRNALIQSAIIPSFRDPDKQLRLAHYTWFGKLMKHLTGKQGNSDLDEVFRNLETISTKIFEGVKNEIDNSGLKTVFPGTEMSIQFNAENRTDDLYKSCLIYIDDGFKSLLTDKGSGIQSAMIISLFKYYIQHVSVQSSALLCLEEPELYLHPHARRVLSGRLDEFVDMKSENSNQVIITTHSTDFIRSTSDDLNVILVKKMEGKTEALPLHLKRPDIRNLVWNSNSVQSEIFFSDKIILCEGYDHFILRAIAEELFPGRLDEQNISIIDVGGKDRFCDMVKIICKSLRIKCFIFADFDFLLRDKLGDNTIYKGKLHKSLSDLDLSFFNQGCTCGDKASIAQSHITKIRTKIKTNNEEQFYTVTKISDLDKDLHEDVEKLLDALRKKGICILKGDIESLSLDPSFISSTKKLSLEKIYELNEKLSDGKNMADLFDTTEAKEFLEVVFVK